ncbi:MAG: class B sortase, partial [Lachnospiraceae bacterium]|nr:class B sortase [Lachnospiraceae bacterium]
VEDAASAVEEPVDTTPTGIQVNNTVGVSMATGLDEDDILFGSKTMDDMLPDIKKYYEQNQDIIGWLKVDDMVIDYPVMQTMDNEDYYLDRDFNKNSSSAGSLIMDTDSVVGDGTRANDYKDGTKPSTNLIIHGHNMRNGSMFGDLDKYRKQDFERAHNIIRFNTLYEEREYEIVSVFLSQVYKATQTDVFKYYKFFEAANEEEFNDFYKNIKKLQLYDTGVTAEYGDEFITLSVCAYHVTNGRLVVVGKRIK